MVPRLAQLSLLFTFRFGSASLISSIVGEIDLQDDDECQSVGDCSLHAIQVKTTKISGPTQGSALDGLNALSDVPDDNQSTHSEAVHGEIVTQSRSKRDISVSFGNLMLRRIAAVSPYVSMLSENVSTIMKEMVRQSVKLDEALKRNDTAADDEANEKPRELPQADDVLGPVLLESTSQRRRRRRHVAKTLPPNTRYVVAKLVVEQKRMLWIRKEMIDIKRFRTTGLGDMANRPNGPPGLLQKQSPDDSTADTESDTDENGTITIKEVDENNIPLGEKNSVMVKRNYKELISSIQRCYKDIKALSNQVNAFTDTLDKWLRS